MIPFSKNELLGFATDLERYSHRFYIQAISKLQSAKHKELFRHLACQEQEHMVVMRGLQTELAGQDTDFGVFDDEMDQMQVMAHGPFLRHCVDFSAQLSKVANDADVLELAAKVEKNAVEFYSALATVLHGDLAVQTVNRLLTDEHQHNSSVHQLVGPKSFSA